MPEQEQLDLFSVDLLAAPVDDVLDPPLDQEVGYTVVLLPAGEVSGPVDVDSPCEDLAPLARAVRGLPEEQRAVLMAAVYHGFTTREISEAWHLPVGTVKTRLRLALGKLRELSLEVAS